MRIVGLLLLLTLMSSADEFFEAKIRPVLVEHCGKCHAAEKAKGGLRVDGREHLLKGGDSGPAVVPGDAKSRLLKAIRYENADLQMPPKGKLPEAVIADFERWVKDGAKWPAEKAKAEVAIAEFDAKKRMTEHWAWEPVVKPPLPKVKNEAWIRDPLDRFVLEKLEAKGLTPATETTKLAWLRRVTYALTGLPPSVDEQTEFENDTSANAYEKVADRLLASPAFGEHWARHWLDLARYAESRGHEFDTDIPNAWLYRDYVIRAFNDDLPYDEFAFEQIAGRGKNGPRRRGNTAESKIGTAFWRLGEEVQSPVDIRQDQADRFDNRIDVYSKTFLGLTVSCARCHDHKFDAISAKDYYALLGLLEGGSDAPLRIDSGDNATIHSLRTPAATPHRETMRARLQTPEYATWLKSLKVISNYDADDSGSWDPVFHRVNGGDLVERGSGPQIEERGAIVLDRYWSKLADAKGMFHEYGKLAGTHRAGFTIRTRHFTLEKDNVWLLVRGGGYSYAAVGGHTLIHGPLHGQLVQTIPDSKSYRWVKHSLKEYKGLAFRMELIANPKTDFAVAMIVQSDEPPPLPPKVEVPNVESNINTAKPMGIEPVWESRLVPGVIDGEAVPERVFIRGNPHSLGISAQSIAILPPSTVSSTALHSLATRTVSERNPYFRRVIVNRLWHHLFGRGIVASVDNFGVLGEKPSHPELLDYLSVEFSSGGYHIKPMLKRMVLSASFRQASLPANDAKDPNNELLHHVRIRRLSGEAIRDGLLMISGRLDRQMGGPPVATHLTPQMEGRGRPGKSGPVDGDGRRSIYLAVRRNFLAPFALAFDAPSPFSTVGRRQESNVPAQALILMNDPLIHQEAKRWGMAIHGSKLEKPEKASLMFRQAFGRFPSASELELCLQGSSDTQEGWAALAHALINAKEFRYIP